MSHCVEWVSCKDSGLVVPKEFWDEKQVLKENLSKVIEDTINKNSHRKGRYFIVFHSRFDSFNPHLLRQKVRIREELPSFMTNQIVFWVDNTRGIAEWLWSVGPSIKQITFNTEGVAYLRAKGAFPTKAG